MTRRRPTSGRTDARALPGTSHGDLVAECNNIAISGTMVTIFCFLLASSSSLPYYIVPCIPARSVQWCGGNEAGNSQSTPSGMRWGRSTTGVEPSPQLVPTAQPLQAGMR
ncbi:hypothetical protein E2562_036816 [Oryza meyeriana var. granulata]|uniref:Uncharacterized protein n=1 Tax=Oryza meyeriana var. granulata TaxID=110450 RepID=A0A6G1E8E0_9ORYZ|nr:hypothetical protein E2562_036816 [Oryza meyeriana var. granulata]